MTSRTNALRRRDRRRTATPSADALAPIVAPMAPAGPPPQIDPEDDDSGRGDFNPGPWLLLGLALWLALAWLLLS